MSSSNGYSITAAISAIARDARKLVQLEAGLAKQEMATKAREAGLGAGLLGGAFLVGWFALATLILAAVLGLAEALPAWLAALIVGGALLIVSSLLLYLGVRHVRAGVPVKPEQAIESSKETMRWAQRKMRSASRSR